VERLWRCRDPTDTACAAARALPDPTAAFCALAPLQWEWTAPRESIASDLGFYCHRAWLLQLAESLFFVGFLFGAAIWGQLSDRFGRRNMLFASCAAAAAAAAANATVSGVPLFMALRILSGAAASGIGLIAFTLVCELVGPAWRGIVGVGSQFFWCTGSPPPPPPPPAPPY
jgi:MFS transporter, OCT family, solute carrier family 22 (organic cation transporter), member 4/5